MIPTTIAGWVVSAAVLVAALGVLGKAGLVTFRGTRKLSRFFDDWFGTPARPGQPARPGFPERVQKLENTVEKRLGHVEEELRPNGGTSLRDAVDRVERSVSESGDG